MTIPVLNSCAQGRYHSLDLDQCIGILGRFISSELQNLSTCGALANKVRESKIYCGHMKKRKILPGICKDSWKYGKSLNFVIAEKWEPCIRHVALVSPNLLIGTLVMHGSWQPGLVISLISI